MLRRLLVAPAPLRLLRVAPAPLRPLRVAPVPLRCCASASASASGSAADDPAVRTAGIGPLRPLPRWERIQGSYDELSQLYGSAARWEAGREQRIAEFGATKQWKTLSREEAMEQYLLGRRDLRGLPYVAKYNVHGVERMTRFYVVFDVQDRALEKWASADVLALAKEARGEKRRRRVARLQPPVLMLLRPVRTRKGVPVVGSRAVGAAILGNMGVVVAKLGGWACTGSGAMLSEAFHSLADLGNQCMLAIGLQQSLRAADSARPYGYGAEQYVWAMISGVSTFILGAGASVYHGVSLLLYPQTLEALPTACAVLGVCGVLESYTLSVAYREMSAEATKIGMTPMQYLTEGPDPLNPAVLLEDSVAVVGVGVAATSIGLTHVTGNPMFDAVGSIAVGTMMGAVAIFIINRNRLFLGQTVPPRTAQVLQLPACPAR